MLHDIKSIAFIRIYHPSINTEVKYIISQMYNYAFLIFCGTEAIPQDIVTIRMLLIIKTKRCRKSYKLD